MTWRDVDAEDLAKLRAPIIVDVRSPCEFIAERIPGAINIPLLTDFEREQVGTAYARDGEVVARRLGLKYISPKIPEIVDRIIALRQKDSALVVHCWRGGLRSESVASFLSIVGLDCWRLKGGYKSWRRMVLNQFKLDAYPFKAIVLHGRTGTGKTDILRELKKLGAQILDLEELASHRGSLFGGLGLSNQPTQKNFEGALWQTLHKCGAGPLFIEAESRRIGQLTLPDFIMNRIEHGHKVMINGSLASRVSRLIGMYMPLENARSVEEASTILNSLTDRLGKQNIAEFHEYAAQGKIAVLVEKLLQLYYDPHYDKHILKSQPFDLELSCDDSSEAAEAIFEWAKKLPDGDRLDGSVASAPP